MALALITAVLLSACAGQGPTVRRSEQRLPIRIESIGVPPIVNAPGVTMNDADREFLRKQLRTMLEEHPPLRTLDAAPNKLPSTALFTGQITGYRSTDVKGENVFARTIDIEAEFVFSYLGTADEPLRFRRAYSYQHAYLPAETVTTQLFDLQSALIEFSALVIAEFFPSTSLDRFDAVEAYDPDSGMNVTVPLLERANGEAEEGRYSRAVSLWELVLYDPNGEPVFPGYKLSRLYLGQMRERGLPDADLEAIADLAEEDPMPYAEFRGELRDRLKGTSPNEDRIAEISDYVAFRSHLNLYAAHLNLAALYESWRQHDLAVYHYAMAWAHSRDQAVLEKWNQIQFDRKLTSSAQNNDATLRLYLRLPPPSTSSHLPGSFAELVLPASKVRMDGIQAQIRRVAGSAEPLPPEPIALPPLEVIVEPVPVPNGGTQAAPPSQSVPLEAPPQR